MSKMLLKANGVHKAFQMGKAPLKVLRGVHLEVYEGELLAVTGTSGCGKSTLLHILGALDLPDRGTVSLGGLDLFALPSRRRDAVRNRDVGFVFQFYHLLPELNVLENVLMPPMVRCSIAQWVFRGAAAHKRACEILRRVGLAERMHHRPNELSGGERQRVAIARAMINKPRFLLADEPTGNLDAKMGREILAVLRSFNEGGQTIVMVTHDPDIAQSADRRVQLVDGRILA